MGAALADADKAVLYCRAAGERALRLLAFEEAALHFSRGLQVAEQYAPQDQEARCDALIALSEAQNRAGDAASANANFERAAALARLMGDRERLAAAALRAGPLGYQGVVRVTEEQIQLLEEARATLPQDVDTRLRALVSARLGLVTVYRNDVPNVASLQGSLDLSNEAVAMARRLGDRIALGHALNARMHALWGVEPAPERLATGTELAEIADEIGDEELALHGHLWRTRELLAQGDVDAANAEIVWFRARNTGPMHPLHDSYACNVATMMALLAGDFATAEQLGQRALALAEGHSEMALGFYGAVMTWTWWQRGDFMASDSAIRDVMVGSPTRYPTVLAARALVFAEGGDADGALALLHALPSDNWDNVAVDLREGLALSLAAAACGAIGEEASQFASRVYEALRPHAGSVIVVRPPAAGCLGPADHYLGLLAGTLGDLALAEVHHEAALRLARRMESPPFVAAAEVELGRTLLRRRPAAEQERVSALLRSGEESARALGLHRLAQKAAAPD
jgi:tetratricopeptide (TPR) repeat protein